MLEEMSDKQNENSSEKSQEMLKGKAHEVTEKVKENAGFNEETGTLSPLKEPLKIHNMYPGVGTGNEAVDFLVSPLMVIDNHYADLAFVSKELFPNVLIPDYILAAAPQLQTGNCYRRQISFGRWCIKIKYFLGVPVSVRFALGAKYSPPTQVIEASRDPFTTRYIPRPIAQLQQVALREAPKGLETSLEYMNSLQKIGNVMTNIDPAAGIELSVSSITNADKIFEAAGKVDEALGKDSIKKYTFASGRADSLRSSEYVVAPMYVTRELYDVVNNEFENKTLAITFSWGDAIVGMMTGGASFLATMMSSVNSIQSAMGDISKFMDTITTIQNAQSAAQQAMDLAQQGAAVMNGDASQMVGLAENFNDTKNSISKVGKLDLSNLLGNTNFDIKSFQDGLKDLNTNALSGFTSNVGLIRVKTFCHDKLSPSSPEEANFVEDNIVSYFLNTGDDHLTGAFDLSRFNAMMYMYPKLSKVATAYDQFMKNPAQCSAFKLDANMISSTTALREAGYPTGPYCSGFGYSKTGLTVNNTGTRFDTESSALSVYKGSQIAAEYGDGRFYRFDPNTGVISWMSSNPKMPTSCGPIFRDYKAYGVDNANGNANRELPDDMPNTAVEWTEFTCCVDGGKPLGWKEVKR